MGRGKKKSTAMEPEPNDQTQSSSLLHVESAPGPSQRFSNRANKYRAMQGKIQALRDKINQMKQQQEQQSRLVQETVGPVVEVESTPRSVRPEGSQHQSVRLQDLVQNPPLTQNPVPARNPTTQAPTHASGPKESLKNFIARFNEEALRAKDYDDKMALSTMFGSLREGKFTFSIGKNPPKTLAELVTRDQKYTNAEEFSNSRKNVQASEPPTKGNRQRNEEPQSSTKKSDDCAHRDRRPSRKPEGRFRSYTPLNTSTEQKLLDIRGQKLLNWPEERTAQREEQPSKSAEELVEIRTIFGGSSSRGDSNIAHKAHSRKSDPKHYVHMTERPRKELRVNLAGLTFTEDDTPGIQHPHDDALVVTMTIANHKVYRILVDTRSSANVIYLEAFERMGIPKSNFRPVKSPLHSLAGEMVISKGAISLPMTVGEGRHQVTLLVDFLVVNVPSVYNVILGRPSLNAMRAVVSTYHLMMKFSTEGRVGYLRGDQREARKCYAIAVRKGSVT
ncbi:uncharacterized protein LOC131227260 [Magnolia sinica]|uniref:uncharacterized protein LOC131227260 n=1 Tax=Magnolia sinica TaxID=86752 RepID=UPI002658A559|nr:uncharacterized protein LOC131227260 [Magnolia sinica]